MTLNDTYLQSALPFNHLDDSSFNLSFYEFSHGPLNCHSGCLETRLFNPVERPELCNPLSSYLDPDSNFVTLLPTGKYVVEEEVKDRLDYVTI